MTLDIGASSDSRDSEQASSSNNSRGKLVLTNIGVQYIYLAFHYTGDDSVKLDNSRETDRASSSDHYPRNRTIGDLYYKVIYLENQLFRFNFRLSPGYGK